MAEGAARRGRDTRAEIDVGGRREQPTGTQVDVYEVSLMRCLLQRCRGALVVVPIADCLLKSGEAGCWLQGVAGWLACSARLLLIEAFVWSLGTDKGSRRR